MIVLEISIGSSGWPTESLLRTQCEEILAVTIDWFGFSGCDSELSIVFSDDDGVRSLNRAWRERDKATNVLSFPAYCIRPGQKPGPMLGDIILARETIEREANSENKSFHDHLSHLIVHGLMHLLGYDHQSDAEAIVMEQHERDILQKLAIGDPYALFEA